MISVTDGTTTLTLNGLLWTNRSGGRTAGSDRRTFGRLVVQRLEGGNTKEITLESRLDGNNLQGWYTWAQAKQLMTWRDNGTALTLIYDTETYRGVIPIGGIDIQPVISYSRTIPDTDKCFGTTIINCS